MTAHLKRKARRRILHTRGAEGQQLVYFPILDEGGKVTRYILIDRRLPCPMRNVVEDVYLRAD